MTPGTLLIRADASVAMGTGHVMRCLALAQAWQDMGGRAVFAMAEATPAINERLRIEGFEAVPIPAAVGSVEDCDQFARFADSVNAEWVVVDGYRFGAGYQGSLKARGLNVLFVDDNGHASYYSADFVLNQNVHAREDLYASRASATQLLLGPQYAMLRREFREWREWKREIPDFAKKILVVMGGSDPNNLTPKIVATLGEVKQRPLDIMVVVGGSNPRHDEFGELRSNSLHSFTVVENVESMPELMSWADLAISAAGTICWEFCALGVPMMLIPIAANQESAASALHRMGAAVALRSEMLFQTASLAEHIEALIGRPSQRAALSKQARGVVDEKGASRVAAIISSKTRREG